MAVVTVIVLVCCRFTHRAARTAAGTAAEMARRLVLGQADNGMALIRPLGHAAGAHSASLCAQLVGAKGGGIMYWH